MTLKKTGMQFILNNFLFCLLNRPDMGGHYWNPYSIFVVNYHFFIFIFFNFKLDLNYKH